MAGGVAVASGEIRHGDRVFSGNSGPAQREQPINKELIAHFKSKGDSVSWGIAASIENYEEDTKRPVLSGACIASLYDQETERELAEEVENRIERVLSDDAALLKIRRYLKTFHADEREWDVRTCAAAARGGNLECLKYLHEHGYPWSEWVSLAAAEGGHLECLKYLHEHGCVWDESACEAAARGGDLECLKYLHEHGCPCDESACEAAASCGDLEFLKDLHEHGCPWDESACSAAARGGHSECLKYLHTHGCPGNKRASEAAAGGDVMECLSLKYLHRSLKRKIYR